MRFTASRVVVTAALLLSGALVVGCGNGAENVDNQAQTRTVITVIREVPADTPADTVERDEQSRDVAEPSSTDDSASASVGSAQSASGRIRVPNVVGKDHQLAQDTMQAAGLYNLSEEDATGQGRMLLFDRNWTVVSQSPKAGTRVSEDATITLRSKKDGEGT